VFDVVASPHPNGGAVVTFDDVTPHHTLAERYRRVVETTSSAIVITDLSRRIAFANPAALALLGAAAVVAVLLYATLVVAAGPGDSWEMLVRYPVFDFADYQTLPFPLDYDGRLRFWPPGSFAHDAKDLLGFYVPLLLVIGLGLSFVFISLRRLQRDPIVAGLAVLGLAYIPYLLSRTDEFHSQPLIVVLAALLPIVALQLPMRARAVLGLVFVALLAYGVSNRLSALVGPPPTSPIHIAVADGVKAPPRDARAIEQMVRAVQRRVPPGDPIYTVTRRSDLVRINDPLIYVLTERDNPTRQDFGLQTGAAAQAEIVAVLARVHPKVIVRWLSRESTIREPNDRGKPSGIHTLDRWLAANYRPSRRYGSYQLLLSRR
jgi:hypothetical protein